MKVDGRTVPGPTSYITKARNEGATYFDMGDEWGATKKNYALTDDDIFNAFNTPVLDGAAQTNKTIKFSHDPREHGGFLKQEWDYLQQNHGYFDLEKIGSYWHAIR